MRESNAIRELNAKQVCMLNFIVSDKASIVTIIVSDRSSVIILINIKSFDTQSTLKSVCKIIIDT